MAVRKCRSLRAAPADRTRPPAAGSTTRTGWSARSTECRLDGTGCELVHSKLPPLEWPLLRENGIFFDRPGPPAYRYLDFQSLTFKEVLPLRLPERTGRCNGFDIAPDGAVVHSRSISEGDIVLLDPVE